MGFRLRRGASFNIPVNRSGVPRTTVGLPGTGLSWSMEQHLGSPRGGSSWTCGGSAQQPPAAAWPS